MSVRALDKDGNVVADSDDSGITWTTRSTGEIATIVMDGATAGVMASLLDRDAATFVTREKIAALRALIQRAPESWSEREADALAIRFVDELDGYLDV